MVLSAFPVPDETSWAVWGHDLRAEGFSVAGSPSTAEVLIAPASVHGALADAVAGVWDGMPRGRRLMTLPAPLTGGADVRALLDGGARAGPADGEHHAHHTGDHGEHGHDHHDAMEVTGEPSADGLVMEDLEFELGPLSGVLPGGVAAMISLDGDVVASCALRATLASAEPRLPDALAPAAWSALEVTDASRRVFDVELERAVSHAAWLARLGRVLGWGELADWARSILRPALAAQHGRDEALAVALDRAAAARRRLERSRRLRLRLRGRAVVERSTVEALGLTGPVARAAGAPADARTRDAAYAAAAFTPVLRDAGDAEARTLVRLEEIVVALRLATARPALGADAPPPPAIEGPRGPVRRDAVTGRGEAPGAAALLRVAGERAAGLEWSDAVAALTSFDLSGWQVAG